MSALLEAAFTRYAYAKAGVTEAPDDGPPDDPEGWLRELFPAYVADRSGVPISLAEHHRAFWAWVWAINPGARPRPFVAIWPRGGGKSTGAELACVAVGYRRTRRYVLYVSSTQQQADDHVANIAGLLESERLGRVDAPLSERSIGKYGSSRGWRRNRLRTAAGFTVDALGLDTAARGVKLDEMRPDLIVLDDIDDTADSLLTTSKKIDAITKKLLPAGSTDAATLAVQNLVSYEGVFARLAGVASEPGDFLADRIISGPHPALIGAGFEKQPDGRWKIVSGTATWDGQNLEVCQQQINDWGMRAFRAEAQHERTPPEGQAFPEFDRSVHVTDPFTVPDAWPKWRAVDYGYAVPYCCLWFTRSPSGRIIVYRERYGSRKTAREQAYAVRLASAGEQYRFSVGDPAMWATMREGEKFLSVADQYGEMGVKLTQASNDRLAGKAKVHDALSWAPEAPPTLQVFSTCTNLIRTLPMLPVDPHKPEDVDCWAAGTMISTPTGSIPIERVVPGDIIDTPLGPRPVLQSYLSGMSETVIVELSDGRALEGTPDHQVYIEGKGLVPLDSLVCYDIPIGRNTWSKWLNIAVSSIAATRGASTTTRTGASLPTAGRACIARFGSMLAERSPIAGMFTTLMATTTITNSRISSACLPGSTGGTITSAASTETSGHPWPNGARVRKGKPYSATMHGRCWSACRHGNVRADIVALLLTRDSIGSVFARSSVRRLSAVDRCMEFVRSVVRSSGRGGTTESRPRPVHIVAVGRSDVRTPVYSIGVADAHLFYANGVLSSNTLAEDHAYDCARYGLMALHWLSATRRREPQSYTVGGGGRR